MRKQKTSLLRAAGIENSLKSFADRIFNFVGITPTEPTPQAAEEIVKKVTADKAEVADKTAEKIADGVKKTVAAKSAEVKEETGEDSGKAAIAKTEEKIVANVDSVADAAKAEVKEEEAKKA